MTELERLVKENNELAEIRRNLEKRERKLAVDAIREFGKKYGTSKVEFDSENWPPEGFVTNSSMTASEVRLREAELDEKGWIRGWMSNDTEVTNWTDEPICDSQVKSDYTYMDILTMAWQTIEQIEKGRYIDTNEGLEIPTLKTWSEEEGENAMKWVKETIQMEEETNDPYKDENALKASAYEKYGILLTEESVEYWNERRKNKKKPQKKI